ncbi:long-chain fatty acid--CoA ligase [candidate division KSB1 bacterium 4572_119]|nr:MAG: long-chain fatty acid--CoA ligase [candidate division KSB1 bacterium 4572_119]
MIELENKTLRCLLNRSVDLFQNEPSITFVGEIPITYLELGQRVKKVSEELKKNGISKGDRVAILGENSPNWGIAYLAITTMGAIAVPILPNFHESEVHHIIRSSGAKVIFISKKLAQKVEEPGLGDLKTIIYLNKFEIQPNFYKTDFVHEIITRGSIDLTRLRDAAKQFFSPSEEVVKEDDLAVIIYTSGTTGHSKGVMLTHKNLVSNLLSISQLISIGPGDRMLSILPLSHTIEGTIGFLVPLATGCAVHYLPQMPTASNLLPALEKVKPTIIISVPLIIEKIYKKKILGQINSKKITRAIYKTSFGRKKLNAIAGKKLYKTFGGKLRYVVIGGAPLGSDTERFLIEGNFPYGCGYGLTETAPLLTGTINNVRFQSVGPVISDVEIKIVNPEEESGIGEIYARGPNVMKGYYKDPEKTAEVFSPDGWFITGDRGYVDKDGYLFIKGRSKNLILGPSGENIYPEEIEQKLNESEYVLESMVFSKDNRIVARVYLDYDILDKEFKTEKLTETQTHHRILNLLEEIKKEVNANVSDFSRIHHITEQHEPFEKTPTHKIKRYLYTDAEV